MIFYLKVKPNASGAALISPKNVLRDLGITAACIAMQPSGDRDMIYEVTCSDASV